MKNNCCFIQTKSFGKLNEEYFINNGKKEGIYKQYHYNDQS